MRVEVTDDYLRWINNLPDRAGRTRIQVRPDGLRTAILACIEFSPMVLAN